MWFATNWTEQVFVSNDGLTMDGSTVLTDDSQLRKTSEWHFTAEREP